MKIAHILCMLLLIIPQVKAHQTSTSYLTLEESVNDVKGLWQVSISSINAEQSMDINEDGNVTWKEIKENRLLIYSVLSNIVDLYGVNEKCNLTSFNEKKMSIEKVIDEFFINVPFKTDCQFSQLKSLKYTYYMNYDNEHKAIITTIDKLKKPRVSILSNENQNLTLNSKGISSFINIIKEGVWHILIGFDHIIFVLTLLIGIMFTSLQKASSTKFNEIIKVITAFTIAHSVTLGLATFSIVLLPIRLVESLIALSLVFAALQNIHYKLPNKYQWLFSLPLWKMAFIFGLIHGFGFASVLSDLNLAISDLALNLLAFNFGVELGQIAIVLLFIAIAISVSNTKFFKNKQLTAMLPVSSSLVIVISTLWLVERSFDIAVF